MKKSAALIASAMLLTCGSASADTLLGVYVGAQGWDMAAEGSHGENGQQDTYNFDDEAQGRYYAALEHPIPFIPNIKIAHTELVTQGLEIDTNAFGTFDLGSEIDLTHTDYTLYYELFDNDLVSFDFGITARDFSGEVDTDELDEIIPLLYLSGKVGLPLTGLSLFAEGNFLAIDDSTITDYQAGIAWAMIENIAIDVSLTVGYRSIAVELDDIDDIYADLDFDGAFAGVEVHF